MKDTSPLSPIERAVLAAGIARGARLLIAVSGGPDSVALLHAVAQLASNAECEWRLLVGHVNHGLRGDDSDADERFVQSLAHDFGIEARTARVDSEAVSKGSIEATARDQRYRLLRAMLGEWPGDAIVTAHTQDDQAETVLLHLLRGAGPSGIAAIRSSSGALLRPLLDVSREEVIDYIQQRHLPYRLDRTNTDLRHTRNRIRHSVMPVLRDITPEPARMLARSARIAGIDAGYIASEALGAMRMLRAETRTNEASADLYTWRSLRESLRHAVLRAMITQMLGFLTDLSFDHVETMERFLLQARENDRLDHQLPHDLRFTVENGRIVIRRGRKSPGPQLQDTNLSIPGHTDLPVGRITASLLQAPDPADVARWLIVCGPNHAFCDASTLSAQLHIRSRRPGDRIRPVGRGGSRKLQDLLVDHKVPSRARDRIPILLSGDRIAWVAGHALDERFAAMPDTESVVHFTFTPHDEHPPQTLTTP